MKNKIHNIELGPPPSFKADLGIDHVLFMSDEFVVEYNEAKNNVEGLRAKLSTITAMHVQTVKRIRTEIRKFSSYKRLFGLFDADRLTALNSEWTKTQEAGQYLEMCWSIVSSDFWQRYDEVMRQPNVRITMSGGSMNNILFYTDANMKRHHEQISRINSAYIRINDEIDLIVSEGLF